MKLRLNVNTVISNKKGEILVVELKSRHYKGGLCIPGGGIEAGEMSEEVARREITEETGIEINNFFPFGFYELVRADLESHRAILLLKGIGEGEPKETEEGYVKRISYDDAIKNLIPFAKQSVKIWKEGKIHFKLIDEEVIHEH